jgi:hypothetical protein
MASTIVEEDVVVSPELSVAIDVRVYTPLEVGVHETVYGWVEVVPMEIPFAKNWTLAIVPLGEVAFAVTVTPVPTVTVPPVLGVTRFTTGGGSAVTYTKTLVLLTLSLRLSTTWAEM